MATLEDIFTVDMFQPKISSLQIPLPKNIKGLLDELDAVPSGSRAMRQRFEENLAFDLLSFDGTAEDANLDARWKYTYAYELLHLVTDLTDWDFSVQYSDYTDNKLQEAGFMRYNFAPYGDILSECVYLWQDNTEEGFVSVEVVAKRNLNHYKQIWDRLDVEYYAKHLWKSSPRYEDKKEHVVKNIITEHFNQLAAMIDK